MHERPAALGDVLRQADRRVRCDAGAAVQERPEFLTKYGFERARRYVLVHDGKSYDSKAIAGAAHRFLPGQTALKAQQFSGGVETVGRLLHRLGFIFQIGDTLTPDLLIELLAKLPVNRSGGPPALYQPITLLWMFGRARRGEPRIASWSQTQREVGALLTRYGRPGETDAVHYPVAALYGAGFLELDAEPQSVPTAHGNSVPRRWFNEHHPNGGLVNPVYALVRESAETPSTAVRTLVERYFTGVDATGLLAELGQDFLRPDPLRGRTARRHLPQQTLIVEARRRHDELNES